MAMTAVERATRWKANNPERAKALARAGYHRHAAKTNAKRRASARLDVSRWAAKNHERVRGYKAKWQIANKVRHSASTLAWQRRHRVKNLARRAATQNRRRARQMGSQAHHTDAEWQALCAAASYQCVACGMSSRLERDHVRPLAKGGSDGIENIQPLCRRCNATKGAREIDYRRHATDHDRRV